MFSNLIEKKYNGKELTQTEYYEAVDKLVARGVNKDSIKFFLSLNSFGMTKREVLFLTKALRDSGKVLSFELDDRLLPVLDETLKEFDNVEIINQDIMKADLKTLIEEKCKGMKIAVCANLPYYITSPIIMMFLESKLPITSITVMVQKEAADRLCAEVGSRDGGAVTVAVNYYAESEILFFVPKDSFLPPPKVDSSVIKLTLRDNPPVEVKNEEFFFKVVKAAFSQRRKTAENSISAGLSIPKSDVKDALEKAGLQATIRAEKMTMEDFATLSETLEK